MFRAKDAWQITKEAVKPPEPVSCGFPEATPESKGYIVRGTLGKGGFGSVVTVQRGPTGPEFACKTIEKRLDGCNLPVAKQNQHIANIKREVSVLTRLRAALNVCHLEEVFEDDKNVYIVMQQCKGGELLAGIGKRHYSERTVASYMRAVLRTLSQCHHHKILHRDIKPGNFMLLDNNDESPVLAIDFGLAVYFDPKKLPCRDLGLEGTPHYMAPECLSSEVYPASDVWAAGVMAYQLLSARFPFDDWKNTRSPSLSQLWKSILTEQPKFGSSWDDVSEGAKDFVRKLLTKDPLQRPTAQQALEHPWIQGKKKQRTEGKPLAGTIVQRLQRFGTESAFKRTVLDMIANDLLRRHFLNQQHQTVAPPSVPGSREGSIREGSMRRNTSGLSALNSQGNLRALAAAFRERSLRGGNQSGLSGQDKSHTVHASSEAVNILRSENKSNLQQALPDFRHTSVGHNLNLLSSSADTNKDGSSLPSSLDTALQQGHNKWYKMFDDMQQQRRKQQKIQRLMLDCSGHGGSQFHQGKLEAVQEGMPIPATPTLSSQPAPKPDGSAFEEPAPSLERRSIFAEFEAQQQGEHPPPQQQQPTKQGPPPEEEGRRGRGAFAALFGLGKSSSSGNKAAPAAPSVSPQQQQPAQMPAICTVKGAHPGQQLAPQILPPPPLTQQQQQQQIDQEQHMLDQQQVQQPQPQQSGGRVSLDKHPLLATGFFKRQFWTSESEELPMSPPKPSQAQGAAKASAGGAAARETAAEREPALPAGHHDIAAQLARLGSSHSGSEGDSVHKNKSVREGTVSKGALCNVLSKLMGGPARFAELQAVLERLQYGKDKDEVSFSQLSEGLAMLGYKLQPHEVEALMREVSVGGNQISQSAFLASQVDWREFQRDYREEWLQCLQNAFQGLDINRDGRICGEEIQALLRDKLPPDEVNLAVQETMMDAAVMSEEGMSFDDFAALFHSDSVPDLMAYESGLINGSVHGGHNNGLSRQNSVDPPMGSPEVSGSHYHPTLPTVMDTGV